MLNPRGEAGRWEFIAAGSGEIITFETIACTIAVGEVDAGPPAFA